MIVRILGEGQYVVEGDAVEQLNAIDELLDRDLEVHAESDFSAHLEAMATLVRSRGRRLPDDALLPSQALIPPPGITIAELRTLIGEDGLVPG